MIIPLVFHRIVIQKGSQWEDVSNETFSKILCFAAGAHFTGGDWELNSRHRWMLTFDDGNITDYTLAFPKLYEKKMAGIFFVVVNRIGTPGYLTWGQIYEMKRYGMCIGSHTLNHSDLSTMPESIIISEMQDSKKKIEDKIGACVDYFSYPFGRMSPMCHSIGLNLGYRCLFTSDHGALSGFSAIVPRNAINSSMRWQQIKSTMNPSKGKRFFWFMEDRCKLIIKNHLGTQRYLSLRNRLHRGR